MRLKSLELNGFKSFAKKTTMEFGSAITSIVGPNGSGKSNSAEAFRFVLGEQSMKSLRGKRGEDLIFGGTKMIVRGNRASVRLVFDNPSVDGRRLFDTLDFDEVMLERVVHRDGVNDYSLNGSQVRLKDIVELLAQANIGASGHHIISQGEADRILSANNRERREMIEDALGLKAYLYKRVEAERKLEKTQENMKQVESLRREIAPHLRFLEKQVQKIEELQQLRASLTDRYQEYLKRESVYLKHSKEELAEEKSAPEEKRRVMEARIQVLRDELSKAQEGETSSAPLITLEQDMRAAAGERETFLRDLSRLQGEHAFIEKRIADLLRRAQDEDTATVPLRTVRAFISSLSEKVASAYSAGALEAMRSALQEIGQATEHFASIIRKEEAGELPELQKEFGEKKKLIEHLEASLQRAEVTEKGIRERVNRMRKEMEDARAAGRDAERELFALMNDRSAVEKEILMLNSRETNLLREENEFKREREEGAVLIGRTILAYEDYPIQTADVFHEERSVQEDRRRKLEKMKIRLEEQGLGSTDEILREHSEVRQRDIFLAREVEDLVTSAGSLRALIAELTETLQTRFAEGIKKINTAFNDFFMLMFNGGGAGLSLVAERKRRYARSEDDGDVGSEGEEDEEVEEGIEIEVHLPQKRIKGLHMLSGGERALTSIALIFAMSQVNPPPFLILDETDAALDEANSRRYGDMIEALAKHSQLILITHNRETMSRAGVLYGVTMGADGASKLLSVRFDEAVAVAK